jgi:hypothetical protein
MLLLHPVSGETLRFVRDTLPPPPGPSVVLDRAEYTPEPVADLPGTRELRIVATYTNRSARPVTPAPCGYHPPSVALEKQVDGRWEPAYVWGCDLPRVCVLPSLAPGASRTDTVVFRDQGPRPSSGFLHRPLAGTYRLTVRVFTHYSGCDGSVADTLASAEASRSAPFRVRERQE